MLLGGLVGHLDDDQVRMLERIRRSSRRMGALVDDLLSPSEMEHGHLNLHTEPCDLSSVVVDSVSMMRPTADDKSIAITVVVDEPLPAMADDDKIEQVMTNLLSNAIRYSPGGSTVQVTAAHEGSRIVIQVADQGQGIPPNEQQLLSQPFTRTSVQPHRR